jgi:hypothetical protein
LRRGLLIVGVALAAAVDHVVGRGQQQTGGRVVFVVVVDPSSTVEELVKSDDRALKRHRLRSREAADQRAGRNRTARLVPRVPGGLTNAKLAQCLLMNHRTSPHKRAAVAAAAAAATVTATTAVATAAAAADAAATAAATVATAAVPATAATATTTAAATASATVAVVVAKATAATIVLVAAAAAGIVMLRGPSSFALSAKDG